MGKKKKSKKFGEEEVKGGRGGEGKGGKREIGERMKRETRR